jgi:hypothetical protein
MNPSTLLTKKIFFKKLTENVFYFIINIMLSADLMIEGSFSASLNKYIEPSFQNFITEELSHNELTYIPDLLSVIKIGLSINTIKNFIWEIGFKNTKVIFDKEGLKNNNIEPFILLKKDLAENFLFSINLLDIRYAFIYNIKLRKLLYKIYGYFSKYDNIFSRFILSIVNFILNQFPNFSIQIILDINSLQNKFFFLKKVMNFIKCWEKKDNIDKVKLHHLKQDFITCNVHI